MSLRRRISLVVSFLLLLLLLFIFFNGSNANLALFRIVVLLVWFLSLLVILLEGLLQVEVSLKKVVPSVRPQIQSHPFVAGTIFIAIALGIIAVLYTIQNAGFGEEFHPPFTEPAKDLWDWLQLIGVLAVPVLVALFGYYFQQAQDKQREQQRQFEEQRITQREQTEQNIANDKFEEETLKTYFDRMTDLLLDKALSGDDHNPLAAVVATARTRATLRKLDGERKGLLIAFLYDSGLVGGKLEISIIKMSEADLKNVVLRGAGLTRARLERADLSGADLSGADLSGADLSGADLSGADLSGADLTRADLTGADLSGADLSGADLTGADLSRADLREANLTGSTLSRVNLDEVVLAEVNSTQADLSRADLSGADLSGTDLTGIDLRGVNLSRADLREADLSGADLRAANLDDTNLTRTIITDEQLKTAASFEGAYCEITLASPKKKFNSAIRGSNISEDETFFD